MKWHDSVFLNNQSSRVVLHTLISIIFANRSLLLTELPHSRSYSLLVNHLRMFETLLDSPDVDLRIAAGEAIIILYENACEHDEEGATLAIEDAVPKLQELAKDSHKYR